MGNRLLLRAAVLAAVAVAGQVGGAMLPGVRGDGVMDLHVGGRDLILHTDGAAVNGFVLVSSGGVLGGQAYAESLGLFVTDADSVIADQLDYVLVGLHDLGPVVGEGVGFEVLRQDLSLTYTLQGEAGIHEATIIEAIPGDADVDGDVDYSDYATLRDAYGTASGAVWVGASFDGDGDVDWRDYVALKGHFGAGGGGGGATVPAPGAAVVLALGAAGLVRRRR